MCTDFEVYYLIMLAFSTSYTSNIPLPLIIIKTLVYYVSEIYCCIQITLF